MSSKRRLRRAEWVGAGLVTVFSASIGCFSIFAGPSYEYSLVCGIALPAVIAICAAQSHLGSQAKLFATARRGLLYGIGIAGLCFATSLLHGWRTRFCDLGNGAAFFALGPGLGLGLAGLFGALAGRVSAELVRGKGKYWLSVLLALLGPGLGVLISLWRFYSSPMIFAFDPFVGFFAGTLYDTVITGLDRLLSYRLGSLGTVIALGVSLAHVDFDPERRRGLRWRRPDLAHTALGSVALATSLGISCSGPALGHYQTTATIIESLGHHQFGARCEVIYSGTILERDAKLVARECDAHVVRLERFFETTGPAKIRVFLFASADEKARLMGAANTYVAKPWREEVYLQASGYPHPVLGHELAHVIAGSFGRGPFKISGPLGGWIPDPGRIEGAAVAASPSEDTDLTLFQWASTMRRLGSLPRLYSVFQLGFLGHNSATAYTAAGAFMAYIHETYGAAALRRWYAGEPIQAVTGGLLLRDVEKRFLERLGSVQVSEQALDTAQARFNRPALPDRHCPHEVDRLEQQAGVELGQNDVDRAESLYRELLELDPEHTAARLELGACELRKAKITEAVEIYSSFVKDHPRQPFEQAEAQLRWADIELGRSNGKLARELLERARASIVDENVLRSIDVKLFAADRAASPPGSLDRVAYEAIVALLVGDFELGGDWAVASAKLASWSAMDPAHGLAAYLLGKNFFSRGRWKEAQEYLDRALGADLEIERVKSEALHTRLVLACALGDIATASKEYALLRERSDISQARREGARRFADRCGVTGLE